MKTLTLTDYIKKNVQQDLEFARLYEREKIINAIAQMILEARKNAQLTQQGLAKRIGTTQSVISRIEAGRGSWVPSLDT